VKTAPINAGGEPGTGA